MDPLGDLWQHQITNLNQDLDDVMRNIYPILLAGGIGSRLWPLSRKSYPKQFLKLLDHETLFQQSAKRLISSDYLNFEPITVITNSDFRFIVLEQLEYAGIQFGNVILEPSSKNTAASILAASIIAASNDPDAIVLVIPSDHIMGDIRAFHDAISTGLQYVDHGNIVTFGIQPSRAETGYGYLEATDQPLDQQGSRKVLRFTEKPDQVIAEKMFNKSNYFWNSGIFLLRVQDLIAVSTEHIPNIVDTVRCAVDLVEVDFGFLRLAEEYWSKLDSVSIDYAIMEKIQNIVMVPYNSKWSDLGCWDAVWLESTPDLQGNVISETSHEIDCNNTLLRTETSGQTLVGLGLENIIAVAMPDAVLVADKNRAQEVGRVVDKLRQSDILQADQFPKDHRPWGWFESLLKGESFQIKRIFVYPGASLSLQSHRHRSEHWVVVEGIASVTVDSETQTLGVGRSTYIPRLSKHRLENNEKDPLVVIEVQIGEYLGEDDIIRYEDRYAR